MTKVFLHLTSEVYPLSDRREILKDHPLSVWAEVNLLLQPHCLQDGHSLNLGYYVEERYLGDITWKFQITETHDKKIGRFLSGTARILDNLNLKHFSQIRERHIKNTKAIESNCSPDERLSNLLISSMKDVNWVVETETEGKSFTDWIYRQHLKATGPCT